MSVEFKLWAVRFEVALLAQKSELIAHSFFIFPCYNTAVFNHVGAIIDRPYIQRIFMSIDILRRQFMELGEKLRHLRGYL